MQVANCWFCPLLLWMHKVSKNNELKLGPVLSAITESLNWPPILLFNMEYLRMDRYLTESLFSGEEAMFLSGKNIPRVLASAWAKKKKKTPHPQNREPSCF